MGNNVTLVMIRGASCFQAVDGAHESLASLKEGPVHDVAWSPTGSHFMVVAGFMPAKTVLFDAKCAVLGSGHMSASST